MEKTAKYLLVTMLVIILVFVLLVTVCAFVDFFNIKTIQVINNERFDDARYTPEVSRFEGKNGFGILVSDINSLKSFFLALALRDYKAEQDYMSNDPYVRNVKVSFLPPDKIVVEIVERQESYKVAFLDKTIYLSKDLVVLGEAEETSVPELIGIGMISCEEGKTVEVKKEIGTALSQIYESRIYQGKDIFEYIQQIDFDGKLTLLMTNNVSVTFGDYNDIAYKMKCLNEIYYEYLHDYNNGILDLSDKNRKVYSPG